MRGSAADNEDALLWTRREAARAMRLSERYLLKLDTAGVLPAVRLGRSVRYRPESLRAALAQLEARQAETSEPRRATEGAAP
jgi:excisionase family DNA binding protein